ncbi:hypothetical protein [Komagataeibacter sp. FNDCR2]|nr:hypothetical protein [Komagataeibacter sp. FNDCR2]MCE2575569.1 hypothetical protein [Komagataeibacter sp. FNDCR2]
MNCHWLGAYKLAGVLWPRRGVCYRRVSLWFSPDLAWMERPRPLDI